MPFRLRSARVLFAAIEGSVFLGGCAGIDFDFR